MGEIQVRWSDLPEELVDSISNRMSSNIDLICIRSICKPWRSAVATTKRIPNRFKPILPPFNGMESFTSSTTFFRVTQPSSPNKGWLIITRHNSKSGKTRLLSPLSRGSNRVVPVDLLEFGVSKIRQSCEIFGLTRRSSLMEDMGILTSPQLISSRVVLVENLVIAVDYKYKIWCCKNKEESDNEWKRIQSQKVEASFWDITVHKGQAYVLDFEGVIWWIRLSDLTLIQFRPSVIVMDSYNMFHRSRYMRLVEYCGDLCIVHHVWSTQMDMNDSLKVYKMDQELMRWVEVSSLEDKTLIVTKDSCFTVLASEYYGCLANAIYFFDYGYSPKVFKLEDGGIIDMIGSFSHSSYFQMFSPPFLNKKM